MKRREFITLLGGAASAWPIITRAQQPAMPVVGFLNSASADGYASMATAFKEGLKEIGYFEGANVAIEYRWANDQYDRLPALATDLVNRRVTVIFANSPSIAAAKAATSTIPIIIMSGDDPVRLGFVASFNRPGGNITGVSILSGELAAKRLALLRELVPDAKAIAVLINSDFGPSGRFQSDVEAAARALSLSIEFLQANTESPFQNFIRGYKAFLA
jgi:putative tryptophan/tyrosine transport system substrate-binding protein